MCLSLARKIPIQTQLPSSIAVSTIYMNGNGTIYSIPYIYSRLLRAVSIILCHDKPKARARLIGKLVDVCQELRKHNNYSSLRAIITAITQATYASDAEMEIFKKEPTQYKTFLSCHLLFLTSGSHQSYRMALKNTAGPCIPSL